MSNSDVVAASVNFAVAVGLVLVAMATVVTRRPALAGWRRFLDYRIWAAMTLIVAAGLDLIGFAILSANGTLGEVGALTLLVGILAGRVGEGLLRRIGTRERAVGD